MTEKLLSERDIDCETAQGSSHSVLREMAGSRHTLGILKEYGKSIGRVYLEYGKSISRVYLEYSWSMSRVWLDSPLVHCQAAVL